MIPFYVKVSTLEWRIEDTIKMMKEIEFLAQHL